MTRTQTSAVADAILVTYVDIVSHADAANDVLACIAGPSGGEEIVWELLALTHHMGFRGGVESDADTDAWWDAMEDLLPRIARAFVP
jgi:hypothetical protein